jgi:hypothetical protein
MIELDQGPMTAWVKSGHLAVQLPCPLYPPKASKYSGESCHQARVQANGLLGASPTSPPLQKSKEKGKSVRRDADNFHVAHIADYLSREFQGCQFSLDMRGCSGSSRKTPTQILFSSRTQKLF